MTVALKKVIDALPQKRRARVEARAAELITLELIRRSASMTQRELAERIGIGQDAVSRLERQPDMLVSTLQRFVESAGGQLEVVVHLHGQRAALRLPEPNLRQGRRSRSPIS